jgi:hypothetical protein
VDGTEHNPLGSGVTLDDLLPVAWRTQVASDDPEYLVSLQVTNQAVLQTILSLDEHHPELEEEPAEVAVELQRVEFKLNLVLDLLGQVLSKQLDLPPRVPVRLGSGHIEWRCVAAPLPGTKVLVEVYLSPHYPRALVLPGITQVAMRPDFAQATLHDLGKPVQDSLEKLIFRNHRRRVAMARRGQRHN